MDNLVAIFKCIFSSGQNGCCFFYDFQKPILLLLLMFYQVRWKQALLESNLSGIHLMTDEKVNRKEFYFRTPLTFSEVIMPSKTHQ